MSSFTSKEEKVIQLTYRNNHSIAVITLNRPTRGNSLNQTLVEDLLKALELLESDDRVRVVLLTGAGKYFCSGMDLAGGEKKTEDKFDKSWALFHKLASFPKPTIARLQGPALGGGVGLAMACDWRFTARSCYFQLAEVRRGLLPAIIATVIVPQIGPALAKEWMMGGERIYAPELSIQGVVKMKETTESMDAYIEDWVSLLCKGAPKAQQGIKQMILQLSNQATDKPYIRQVFEQMLISEEAAYGIKCFLSKTQPDWSSLLRQRDSKL